MFEIHSDICSKILEECEKYAFWDYNKLSNYEGFGWVIFVDDKGYSRLIAIKKIIMYLFGTLNDKTNTISLDGPINAIIPEEINDYSLGSFRKFNHPDKNNNNFCINCVNCKNCTGCIDCTGCRKCNNCHLCEKCFKCDKCDECKNCKKCFDCGACRKCELCNNCELCDDCYDCDFTILCDDCSMCYGCQHCNNCELCNDCLGCDNSHYEEGVDHDD